MQNNPLTLDETEYNTMNSNNFDLFNLTSSYYIHIPLKIPRKENIAKLHNSSYSERLNIEKQ